MQEMRVGSLGQEDLLDEGMATHSSILALRSHMLCDVAKRWEYSGPPVGEPLGVFLFSSDVLVWGSLGLS